MEQQTTKVLVVDDNPEIRDIIHVLLEGEGIRVTEAADGSSALHFLEKGSFDLIILDIMMPGLNGYVGQLPEDPAADQRTDPVFKRQDFRQR